MKLKEYLKESNLKISQFAKLFKKPVSPQTVRNWIKGTCLPIRHYKEIKKLTGDKVTLSDFINTKGK